MPLKPPWATLDEGDLIFGLSFAVGGYTPADGTGADGLAHVWQYTCELDELLEKPTNCPKDNEALLLAMLRHSKYRRIVHAPTTRGHEANWRYARLPTDVIDAKYLQKENAFLRAKSKGVLWWATTVVSRKVHFVLDSIDLDAVVKKNQDHHIDEPKIKDQYVYFTHEFPPGKSRPGQEKFRVISNAELRWIYRNRMVPNVANLVQFWREGTPCFPPWDQLRWWHLWRRQNMWKNRYTPGRY